MSFWNTLESLERSERSDRRSGEHGRPLEAELESVERYELFVGEELTEPTLEQENAAVARFTTFAGPPEHRGGTANLPRDLVDWFRDATGFRGWLALLDAPGGGRSGSRSGPRRRPSPTRSRAAQARTRSQPAWRRPLRVSSAARSSCSTSSAAEDRLSASRRLSAAAWVSPCKGRRSRGPPSRRRAVEACASRGSSRRAPRDYRKALVDLRRLVRAAAHEDDSLLAQARLHGRPVDHARLHLLLDPDLAAVDHLLAAEAAGGERLITRPAPCTVE